MIYWQLGFKPLAILTQGRHSNRHTTIRTDNHLVVKVWFVFIKKIWPNGHFFKNEIRYKKNIQIHFSKDNYDFFLREGLFSNKLNLFKKMWHFCKICFFFVRPINIRDVFYAEQICILISILIHQKWFDCNPWPLNQKQAAFKLRFGFQSKFHHVM